MLPPILKHSATIIFTSIALHVSHSYAQADFLGLIDSMHNTKMSTASRMEVISASLMNKPYVDGNLGEGKIGRYDQDPLFRFDVFDCTTYVETVLAGALSSHSRDFPQHMQKIRYQQGIVSFVTRNHFTSTDWIPNNQWLLTDITATVGQGFELSAETIIDKKAWYRAMSEDRLQGLSATVNKQRLLDDLHRESQPFSPESVKTPYIPLTALFVAQRATTAGIAQRKQAALSIQSDSLLDEKGRQKAWHQLAIKSYIEDAYLNQALLNRIPSGSIISMVRPNYDVKQWIGTNLNVTHQSIAIRKNGQLYLRHASQLRRKVVDERFTDYFSKYLINSSLKGFNIQRPTF
ncbi:N-acetylmuramoyl-L-alanine amidase-like domain-containing protein [Marinomonas atlantica]|uniref:N-acetylmuramoyl-L-alanine amidase-like domain-containing protein n=1 Tax=Marinomonas atlantica TaxID=1806668 RepID=UPI00082FBF42|nr:N-acetylmuramoyl-L-alanine amidase-like domain-containing protein [Marinomonas atlantica]